MSRSLSALEVEDLVTLRDVVSVIQRAEMVQRIAEEIDSHIVELGETAAWCASSSKSSTPASPRTVACGRRLLRARRRLRLEQALDAPSQLSTEDLLDQKAVAAT